MTTVEWCEKAREARLVPPAAAAGAAPATAPASVSSASRLFCGCCSSRGGGGGKGVGAGGAPPAPPQQHSLEVQSVVADGRIVTTTIPLPPPAAYDGGGPASASASASAPPFDPLSPTAVDLLSISEHEFATLPEGRLLPLLRAQLYAASPYSGGGGGGAWSNVTAVLGSNPLFWALPVSWSVRPRPPYAFAPHFVELRRRVMLRERWRRQDALAEVIDERYEAALKRRADAARTLVPV